MVRVPVPQKFRHLFRLQVKVVQKHGAQFETNASKPLLMLLMVPVPLRLLLMLLMLVPVPLRLLMLLLLLMVPVPLRLLLMLLMLLMLLLLLLLLPLNAPNELLLAEDAVLGRHPFFNHVLYDAVVHKRVHDAQGVLRLRVDQKVVQVAVQIQFQVHPQIH
jgi:hypothetical protein